jgi:1-aminocyclopropane-1-carboxylate deaminase/D-cysteine desulfhydrase-like pyridoxal-dependent ACC family enzyme
VSAAAGERLGEALRGLPRIRLALLPTPLQPAPRLGERLGIDLLVKREDQSGLGLGGNKARQVEVLIADAVAGDADTVLTTAGAQSNFCRAFAAGAARLGLRCILLLRGDRQASPVGNLLLDLLFGAEIHWIDTADPYDPAVLERLHALAAAAGERVRIVHLPGEAGPLAAAAATSLALELAEQCHPEPTAIYLAAGSGLTAAGLALGCEAAGLPARVRAVSVQQPGSFIEPLIRRRAGEAAALLGLDVRLAPDRLVVDDGWIEPGYGQPSRPALDALAVAARLEGWVLDPVYTGKALAGLIADAQRGDLAGERVVFLHSGGAPSLFAHGAAVARHLMEPA